MSFFRRPHRELASLLLERFGGRRDERRRRADILLLDLIDGGLWVRVREPQLDENLPHPPRVTAHPHAVVEVAVAHLVPEGVELWPRFGAVASLPGDDGVDRRFRSNVVASGSEGALAAALDRPARSSLGLLMAQYPFGLSSGRLVVAASSSGFATVPGVLEARLDALALLGGPGLDTADRLWGIVADDPSRHIRHHAARLILSTLPEKAAALGALLADDPDPALRVVGIQAVGGEAALGELVETGSPEEATLALDALGGSSGNEDRLFARLRLARPVGVPLIQPLSQHARRSTVDALLAFLESEPHPRDRLAAQAVLGSVRHELGLPSSDGALALVEPSGGLALVDSEGALSEVED